MESEDPKLYIAKMTKAARTGKIYVDFQRNDRGATSVAPYSPRARAGAPVSMPLEWSELDARSMPRFTATEFAEWSKRLESDPWKKLLKLKQKLKLPK
jgi:bifunctional non-homologous end joining protein LigD